MGNFKKILLLLITESKNRTHRIDCTKSVEEIKSEISMLSNITSVRFTVSNCIDIKKTLDFYDSIISVFGYSSVKSLFSRVDSLIIDIVSLLSLNEQIRLSIFCDKYDLVLTLSLGNTILISIWCDINKPVKITIKDVDSKLIDDLSLKVFDSEAPEFDNILGAYEWYL